MTFLFEDSEVIDDSAAVTPDPVLSAVCLEKVNQGSRLAEQNLVIHFAFRGF